jgi:hypothetical protein
LRADLRIVAKGTLDLELGPDAQNDTGQCEQQIQWIKNHRTEG